MLNIEKISNFLKYSENSLTLDGRDVKKLIKKYKTPCYIYSKNKIKENYENYVKNLSNFFDPNNFDICFSVKSNFNKDVLAYISSLGMSADVVSAGEIKAAIKAKFNLKKIVFSGIGKTNNELTLAIKKSIGLINIESESELKSILSISTKYNRRTNIGFRLNFDIDQKKNNKMLNGSHNYKFGIPSEKVIKMINKISKDKYDCINFSAISIHIGSQITKLDVYDEVFTKLKEFYYKIKDFIPQNELFTIDIGGGLGILDSDAKNSELIINYCNIIKKYFDDEPNIRLILDSGQSIIGNAGILISKIVRLKESYGKYLVVLNAGINNFMRHALHGSTHNIIPLLQNHCEKSNIKKYDFVVQIFESYDILLKNKAFYSLNEGDKVVLLNAGAYGSSMQSDYNLKQRASELLV